jgi:hypothetical protein
MKKCDSCPLLLETSMSCSICSILRSLYSLFLRQEPYAWSSESEWISKWYMFRIVSPAGEPKFLHKFCSDFHSTNFCHIFMIISIYS